MRDLYRSPLFRLLVCLVLICSLLINLSPIRVHAVDPVSASMLTIGAAACMMLMAAGVVFNPQTQEQLEGIGQSFSTYMYQWGTSAEKLDQVEELFNNLTVIEGGGGDDSSGDDEDESPNEKKFEILDAVMVGIGSWIVGMVAADALTYEEEETAPDGYAYYNGVLLPRYNQNDAYPYVSINYTEAFGYRLWKSNFPFVRLIDSDSFRYWGVEQYTVYYCYTVNDSGVWTGSRSTISSGYTFNGYGNIIWSNYDIYDHYTKTGEETLFFEASEPVYVSSETVTIVPDAYVGDTPDQIKNGEINADEIAITSPLVYGNILTSGDTLADIQAAAQGLVTDPATYPQYIQNITYNQTINPDPGVTPDPGGSEDPDPGEAEDPDAGVSEDPEVTLDLSDLALDLSDYFPFCIPFDLYDFFACLNAEPVAPVIAWQIPVPGGDPYPLELDLSVFDEVAQLLRRLQLLLFCVGLAFKTRDLIKG